MRFIDLALTVYEGMPKFWGDYHAPVKVEVTGTYEKNKCMVRKLEMATHSATHVDAPAHFCSGATTIDNVPLAQVISRAVVLDASGIGERGRIGLDKAKALNVGPDVGVIIRTLWDRRWDSGKYFTDIPGLDYDAAQYLLEKGIKFLAVDFPLDLDIHRLYLGNGRILIENLTHLEEIKEDEVWLLALPVKLRDGDGAPARVVAVEGWCGQ
ncbi:MAG: cyclase family protein [Firmicutes bacterium]|nr:cyclase family protein [Bacillota bacterium]